MTQLEKMKVLVPEEPDDAVLEYYLESAKAVYLNLRFPYATEMPDEVETRYLDWQIRAAVEMYARAGMEGETAHTENGTTMQYDSSTLSATLRKEIVPMVGVIG